MSAQQPSPIPEFIILGSDGRHYYADLKTFRQWVSLGSIPAATQVYSQSLGRWSWASELSAFRNRPSRVDTPDHHFDGTDTARYLVRGPDGKDYTGDLAALRQWAGEGRISAATHVYLRAADEWVAAGRIAGMDGAFITPFSPDPTTVGPGTSSRQAALIVVGVVSLAVVFVTLLPKNTSSPSSSSRRETSSAASAGSSEWLPAASHLWTGVVLYDSRSKQPVFEVLGGSENYLAPNGERIRGLKVRYPSGSVEWKDRTWVIGSGRFVVRATDPALQRMEWRTFEY